METKNNTTIWHPDVFLKSTKALGRNKNMKIVKKREIK